MPLERPDFLQARMRQPVAVFGGAVSGGGAGSLLSRLGLEWIVYDRNGTKFDAPAAACHALVVFSPGFPPSHPWIELARKNGCVCLGELDFASLFWRGRILAITGTNGKTTLTEFLGHALAASGISSRVAGNIGYPLSGLVADLDGGNPETIAVCEVSSFQAETLGHMKPDSVLWTNFAEDHLERHEGMDAYFRAKWELASRAPAGRFLAGTSVASYASAHGWTMPAGSSVPTEGLARDPGLEGTPFERYPQRENFVLAAAWWALQGFPIRAIYDAAGTFGVGRHRLSRVHVSEGITFWNDSKATNFHAVEAALAGFHEPVVLIAGGRSKGGDIAAFARRIAPKLAHAVLIGETAPTLESGLAAEGVACTRSGSLEEAVRAAASACPRGGHVLLSPGFASFDMFRSYEDRGNQFERLVNDLFSARV